ncbi:FIG00553526: hypothetical protein [Cronobacter malonaticus 681]|nr:FIG00553526: hypothetical protein [Cronobacter malonaticus 681]
MPNPATLRAQPALHWSSEALASMLCCCFDGYLVPFQLDGAVFAYRFGAENVCLNASRVWLAGRTHTRDREQKLVEKYDVILTGAVKAWVKR